MAKGNETHAAPPDAGGHLGTYTVPEDVLSRSPTQDEKGPKPPLQQQSPPQAGGSRGIFIGMWILIMGLFALGMALAFR